MALDATIGGPDANSYVLVSEADDYFANHWSVSKNTLWTALSTAQKENVLKRATKLIEGLRLLDTELGYGALPPQLIDLHSWVYNFDLTIHRCLPNQALTFPRNVDVDVNSVPFIPQEGKDAECEQAVYLLAFDDSPLVTRMSGIGEETISAGQARIHQTFKTDGSYISPEAYELLRRFIRPTKRYQRA